MSSAVAFVIGVVFAAGLIISGMAVPANVRAFLDVTSGAWDPTLAFVMVSAIVVCALLFRLAARRARPLLSRAFKRSQRTRFDASLVIGAVVFGAGWGISGVCPGPAVVGAATLDLPFLIFALALVAGMALFSFVEQTRNARSSS